MDDNREKTRILILGGYGNFGKRIAEQLAADPDLHLLLAGRDLERAQQLAQRLHGRGALIEGIRLDVRADHFAAQLRACAPGILVHTAGPFQRQGYAVAEACIDAGIHYIDLADGRDFVVAMQALDTRARAAGVMLIPGASTVPGVSSAVVDAFSPRFSRLDRIEFGITPGNRVARGEATIRAILTGVGQPFRRWDGSCWQTAYGWQDNGTHRYRNGLGRRWLASIDIPDLELFPQRYPGVSRVRFFAGLELGLLHHTLWLMSWLSRWKIVKDWGRLAKPITWLSRRFMRFGSEDGGMFVNLDGLDRRQRPCSLRWTLLAPGSDGPYIPTIPAILAVRHLLEGRAEAGVYPCMGLFRLDDFMAIASGWGITASYEFDGSTEE